MFRPITKSTGPRVPHCRVRHRFSGGGLAGPVAVLISLMGSSPTPAGGPGPKVGQGPPPGWELVKITDDPEQDRHVCMNNRGQIVFSKRHIPNPNGTQEEIYLYENGKLRRVTYNDNQEESPRINDEGTMVWQRRNHATGNWQIIRLQDGVEEEISDPSINSGIPDIGNSGLIMWSGTPVSTSELYEYRDGVVTQVTNNGLTNRVVRLNSDNDYAWVRYNFGVSPWVATMMCSIGGVIHELTDGTTQAQGCDINDLGVVGWNDEPGIMLWQNGNLTVIPNTEDDSAGPFLNNTGDVLYAFWAETYWGAFLVRNEVTYQLNDSQELDMGGGDIADDGTVGIYMGDFPEIDVWLMWRVREPGDFTGDGTVDAFDFASYLNCMSNVECGVQMPPVCLHIFDLDVDGDIDFADFGVFQRLAGANP